MNKKFVFEEQKDSNARKQKWRENPENKKKESGNKQNWRRENREKERQSDKLRNLKAKNQDSKDDYLRCAGTYISESEIFKQYDEGFDQKVDRKRIAEIFDCDEDDIRVTKMSELNQFSQRHDCKGIMVFGVIFSF